jgi:parallel beta-helix repeat protein
LVRAFHVRIFTLFAVLAGVSFFSEAVPAVGAATYTVDSTLNGNTQTCSSAPNDCTLRGAINRANAASTPGDIIDFSPLFATPQTISTNSQLPTLTGGSDTIDATGRFVTIDGAAFSCLRITANSNTIKGLRLTGCTTGIEITGGTGNLLQNNIVFNNGTGISVGGSSNTIAGNLIGVSEDGSAVHPAGANTGTGVLVSGTGNTIGGDTAAERNVISANALGVDLAATATGNFVRGNYIGTNSAGTADLGNTGNGISVRASSNTIGGSAPGEGNLISGNDTNGIDVADTGITSTVILGNLIGTNSAGNVDLGNTLDGINLGVGSTSSTVGGTAAGARNVISGNNSDGIQITSSSANTIRGNYIGTNSAGTAALGNAFHGVNFAAGTGTNTVGGLAAGAGNLISGNGQTALNILSGNGNVIQGNTLGADVTGTSDLGNGLGGIIANTSGNTIGGTTPAARNLIAGNNSTGITLSGAGATGNTVQGNYIGVQTDGVSSLPNTSHGVAVSGSASGNTIGGAPGGENVIAHNGGDGVLVLSGSANLIRFNVLHANGGLGIDLGTDGVTPNDGGAANDNDTGANTLLNFPVLTIASSIGGVTNVQGNYDGAPNATLNIDFYQNTACDPSANGEGLTFITSIVLLTNGSGNATINEDLPIVVPAHDFITATATDVSNNTSEFSNCIEVPPLIVNDASDPGDGACTLASCTLREAITAANLTADPDVIEFAIASGPQLITPTSALPAINHPLTIDGSTQPGFAGSPIIELSGNLSPPGTTALQVLGGGTTIKGLVVNRWGSGINISNVGGNAVQGNYIGISAAGTADLGNSQDGILLTNSPNNLIGGSAPGEGNVISGNNANGVRMTGVTSTGNRLEGNIIGLNAAGTADLGNNQDGVQIQTSAAGNIIGGDLPGRGNVISGNNSDGIETTTSGNTVVGNLIGTDVSGELDLGNTARGVVINSTTGNTIGGIAAGARNIISGNGQAGLLLSGAATSGNFVYGNYLGTNIGGTLAIANGTFGGILISNAQNNDIGGASPGQGNVISGNPVGIRLDGGAANGNRIRGNTIGLRAGATGALPNSTGIYIAGGNNNLIGGAVAGQENIIAFNNSRGVLVELGTGNTVGANSIYSNGTLGIDVGSPGITPNDTDDPDTGANRLQNFPVLTQVSTGGIDTMVSGSLNSTPSSNFTIDLYYSTACDSSGNGEGQNHLGSVAASTDAGGDLQFAQTFAVPVPAGSPVTATATNTVTGDTSEFSACSFVIFNADRDGDLISDIFEDACGSNLASATSIPERLDGTFGGADDDGDTLVDESLPPAAIDSDCDGDGYLGLTESGSPFCLNDLNDDPAGGDTTVNDGCPASGPPEAGGNCADSMDNDADGKVNDGCPQSGAVSEGALHIGTSDQDPCGNNGWPSNLFDPVGQPANHISIQDVLSFVAPERHLDTSPGDMFYNPRWDLLPGPGVFGKWINVQDILALLGGATGAPPMLGGGPSLNKTCPWPP